MSKTRIIAVANQKGGVGKTTTAVNLAACLAELGKKTLMIDADPQGNGTSGLGFEKNTMENTVYEVLLGEIEPKDAIAESYMDDLWVMPSNINLAGAEIELIGVERREYILKDAVNEIKDDYDFIVIDCPPSLSTITINALVAADTVLVPIQCEYFALEGLSQLIHSIGLIKKSLNPALEIEGIVFTMFDSRTHLSVEVIDEVKKSLGNDIYYSIIPRNVRLAEAPSYGLPIIAYDSKSKGAEGYRLLGEQVAEKEWN
ncbi:MAG: ParA family protein [Lachnospiraceae bacterium]|nr:ParA family protein [Lachnospiraceae bacterium]